MSIILNVKVDIILVNFSKQNIKVQVSAFLGRKVAISE
jgi:hypothetical protein